MEDLFRVFCCRAEEEDVCENDVDSMARVHQKGVLLSRVGKSSPSPPRPKGPVPQLDLSRTRRDAAAAARSSSASKGEPDDECGGVLPPRDVADDSTDATNNPAVAVSQNGTSAYDKPLVAHIKKASVRDGLGVQTDAADRVTLYISSIGDGPVADYNATVPEELQFVDHSGYVSLFPLLLRLIPPESPRLAHLLGLLGDPKKGIWSDFGLRSLSKKDKMYLRENAAGDAPYWRGPIWINCNFLAVRSLQFYAGVPGPNQERAAELLKSLSANLVQNMRKNYQESGFLWEQYNPKDGKGQRTHPFNGWSSLVVLIMA